MCNILVGKLKGRFSAHSDKKRCDLGVNTLLNNSGDFPLSKRRKQIYRSHEKGYVFKKNSEKGINFDISSTLSQSFVHRY